MAIPFIDLTAQYNRLKPEIDAAIQGVLDDGQYILGSALKNFETEAARYSGVAHCAGVSSGTDALLVPLMCENIGRGDAVFVPSFTYTASAEVILLTPVFVDVDEDDFNIDVNHLEARIAEVRAAGNLRPAAIIAVDLFGLPADYDRLNALADSEGLMLIADAAQSYGAALDGRKVGSLAPVTATSFFPAKPLGCYGDGGAIFTGSAEMDALIRSIRTHGQGSHKYDVVRVGLNARLDTLQAAVLSVKLSVLSDEIEKREKLAKFYDSNLGDWVRPQVRPGDKQSAHAQYTFKTENRDALQNHLQSNGIPAVVYYPRPMHFQQAYEAYGEGPGSLPVSEKLCGEVISLPMHPYMSDETSSTIVDCVRRFFV